MTNLAVARQANKGDNFTLTPTPTPIQPPPSPLTTAGSEGLQPFTTDRAGYICDVCEQKQPARYLLGVWPDI
jgi:hypothetical protein